MSETLTIGQLREQLSKLAAQDGDYTNITELKIKPEFKRIQLVTDDGMSCSDTDELDDIAADADDLHGRIRSLYRRIRQGK